MFKNLLNLFRIIPNKDPKSDDCRFKIEESVNRARDPISRNGYFMHECVI